MGITRTNGQNVKVLVVEASAIAREAIDVELGSVEGVEIVGWTASVNDVPQLIKSSNLDLVVLSLDVEDGNGFELYAELRATWPQLDVLLFDTIFRLGRHLDVDDTSPEMTDQVCFAASYVVATQLVPKVHTLYNEKTEASK